ncbi:MAG: DUF308 domain-containing protein [Bacillota bacterium]
MRVFKMAAGVILILSGIFCFANPGATFQSIAFLMGCAMLLSGASGILAYIWISKKMEASSLLLVEGILSVILGILVLTNQLLADAAIPVFFGMWVMFSGISRVVEGYTHRQSGMMTWCWLLSLGTLGILIGLYAFFNTVLFTFSAVMLVGILFVMQGVNVLFVGINLSFHNRIHKARKARLSE